MRQLRLNNNNKYNLRINLTYFDVSFMAVCQLHYYMAFYAFVKITLLIIFRSTVVPGFSNPLDERPPAVNDHVINVPKIVNVNVTQISVHLPNADADSNPLVIRICYKGQCKQIPCFRRPCYAKIARDRYNSR